jgi:hypothetical protein
MARKHKALRYKRNRRKVTPRRLHGPVKMSRRTVKGMRCSAALRDGYCADRPAAE